jgi:hypothetical protein
MIKKRKKEGERKKEKRLFDNNAPKGKKPFGAE